MRRIRKPVIRKLRDLIRRIHKESRKRHIEYEQSGDGMKTKIAKLLRKKSACMLSSDELKDLETSLRFEFDSESG